MAALLVSESCHLTYWRRLPREPIRETRAYRSQGSISLHEPRRLVWWTTLLGLNPQRSASAITEPSDLITISRRGFDRSRVEPFRRS